MTRRKSSSIWRYATMFAILAVGTASAFGQTPPEFTPDTLWISTSNGGIYEVTLSRDSQGVPHSSGIRCFDAYATSSGALSPGLAFFNGELYYASPYDGTIYRYQADGARSEYATGFTTTPYSVTGLLFESSGNLLACETGTGKIWNIPFGGGTATSFDVLLETPDVQGPISLARDPHTDTIYISDLYGGRVLARDGSGSISEVSSQGIWGPTGLQSDGAGNVYVSRHGGGGESWVIKIDPEGVQTAHIPTPTPPEGIAADRYGFFYVGLNDGRIVRFDASGNAEVLLDINKDADQIVWYGGAAGSCNEPPVAIAGPNQRLHGFGMVHLDGSESHDDNTPTEDLTYEWSFLSRPVGSSATLNGADTATPSFDADVLGEYRLRLIVTDEQGLSSTVDEAAQVTVSADNQAPTAVAGDDVGGVVGLITTLDGSASSDPDEDPLTYSWTFHQTPAGSGVVLLDAEMVSPYFVPDVPGLYVVRLIVNDGYEDSAHDDVTITVISGAECAENWLLDAMSLVSSLQPEEVTTKGNQNALLNHLSQAIRAAQAGDYAEARMKLESAMDRTDGWLRGAPDGNGPGRDWIVSIPHQMELYLLLVSASDCLPL